MNSKKIFLVNVSKGRVGEDNSALLGAMLITKIQLAAMERVRIPEDDRKDFYLYVDEFQNFATDSFANILSEARKYRLNLIMAHQYVGQLTTDTSTKVRDAIFGNVGTMITFRVGAADAEFLEKEFTPEFSVQDLVNLPNRAIYLKLMVDGVASRPFSASTLPPFKKKTGEDLTERIIDISRAQFAKPRSEVEKEISERTGYLSDDGAPQAAEAPRYPAVCSSCGKNTTVPFEPIPGKPVYCKDCLAKLRAAEEAKTAAQNVSASRTMSDIKVRHSEPHREPHQEMRKHTPEPRREPRPQISESREKPISLSALKPLERPSKPRMPDTEAISDLRSAIARSLEEKDKGE